MTDNNRKLLWDLLYFFTLLFYITNPWLHCIPIQTPGSLTITISSQKPSVLTLILILENLSLSPRWWTGLWGIFPQSYSVTAARIMISELWFGQSNKILTCWAEIFILRRRQGNSKRGHIGPPTNVLSLPKNLDKNEKEFSQLGVVRLSSIWSQSWQS